MSEAWYYRAFDLELGPMSWDDLQQCAARGDLCANYLVRRGAHAAWIEAKEMNGLFPAGDLASARSGWHCEIMGVELGPMSIEDLRALAKRGNLRSDNRVHSGDGNWKAAECVPGLMATTASENPKAAAGAAQLEFDMVAAPALAAPVVSASGSVAAADPDSADQPGAAPASAGPSAFDARSARPAAVAAASKSTTRSRALERRCERRRERLAVRISRRQLAGIGVAVSFVLAGCGCYWLYQRLGASGPDERQVASSYRHVYEEMKRFQKDPRSRSPEGLKFQVGRRVAALQGQLRESTSGSAADRLAQAGAQLRQMLGSFTAGPDSPEAASFAESERQFLQILDSVSVELSRQ